MGAGEAREEVVARALFMRRPHLLALAAALVAVFLAAAARRHFSGGIESGLVAAALCLVPAHGARWLAAAGRAEAPGAALLLLELAAMAALATRRFAPLGTELALLLAFLHATRRGDARGASSKTFDILARGLLLVGLASLAREALESGLAAGRFLLFLPAVVEAFLPARERSDTAALGRSALALALLGTAWLQGPAAETSRTAIAFVGGVAGTALSAARQGQRPLLVPLVVPAGTALLLHDKALASLLLLLGAASVPAAVAENGRAVLVAERWRRALAGLGVAWTITALALFLVGTRARVGGVDFFYYVCFARDLAEGAPVAEWRHGYFPGVYAWWRAVMAVSGRSLASLQWGALVLLLLNAFLASAVAARASRSAAAGAFAGLLAALLSLALEGAEGCTEPIAALPVLVALLLWNGAPLSGARGLARAIALGAGFGLGLYAKQQGGLLSLAWLSLLPDVVSGPLERRHRLSHVLAIPLVASGTFLAGILLEGEGMAPLRYGLASAYVYPPQGSFSGNSAALLAPRPTGLAFLATALAGGAWLLAHLRPRERALAVEPWARVLAFSAVAAGAALLQLTKRAYPHYLLLAAPFVAVAVAVAGARLAEEAPLRRPLARFAWLAAAAIFLGARSGVPGSFSAWSLADEPPETRWYREAAVERDLARVASFVRRGDDLLLVPPGRNEVHFLLGTRATSYPGGYGWGTDLVTLADVDWPCVERVLVLPPRGDPFLAASWKAHRAEETVASLSRRGFVEVASFETMRLWRRAR